jgi:RNA polymerase sigma-70 factor (ECF subfamily)
MFEDTRSLNLHLDTSETTTPTAAIDFESVCVPLLPEMTRFARTLARDHALADDLVQDAMVLAMRAWDRWTPKGDNITGSARSWLYKIISHAFVSQRHRRTLVDSHNAEFIRRETEMYGRAAHVDAHDSVVGDEVLLVLARLSADHREVVMRHYVQGHTCEQIAADLGIAKKTVHTRLGRARRVLKGALQRYSVSTYRVGAAVAPAVVRRRRAA